MDIISISNKKKHRNKNSSECISSVENKYLSKKQLLKHVKKMKNNYCEIHPCWLKPLLIRLYYQIT